LRSARIDFEQAQQVTLLSFRKSSHLIQSALPHLHRLPKVKALYSKPTPSTNHNSDKNCRCVVACDHAKLPIYQLGGRHAGFDKIAIQWQFSRNVIGRGYASSGLLVHLLAYSRCSFQNLLFDWRLTLSLCHTNQK